MTPEERKQAEEIKIKVCRILSDYHRREDYLLEKAYGDMQQVMEAYASLKLAEERKDMYPKAFVEWATLNAHCEGGSDRWFWKYDGVYDLYNGTYTKVGTTDELFEYWKQNISK